MKNIYSLFLLLLTFDVSFAQNLITKPGFESGTSGWGGWWLRDNNGNATAIATPVHSGAKALLLNC